MKNRWVCNICNKSFRTRRILFEHRKIHRENGETTKTGKIRKERKCKFCNRIKVTTKEGNSTHERFCKSNPNKSTHFGKGLKRTDEEKRKISLKMKEHAKNGLLHNIGKNRWKCEPSYPESWFIEVIQNEFNDKDYIYEYPVGKFSIDFAWHHKMRCIEIDGEQHYQFEEQRKRDIRKNKFLKKNGWDLLRIRWVDMYNDPKTYIKIAKEFVDNGIIIPPEKRYKSRKEIYEEKMFKRHGTKNPGSEWRKFNRDIWENRLKMLDKYDKTKSGWISKAMKETGLSKVQIQKTCDYFGIEFRTRKITP